MNSPETKGLGIADWFSAIFISGAAKIILKVVFAIYATLLVGLISLIIGVSIFAILALIGSVTTPVIAVVLGAAVCCFLLLGPLPGWVKSIVASLRHEMIPATA